MEELKEFLLTKGFCLNDCMTDDNGELSHLTLSKTVEELDFIYLLVAPHDGTQNRYMFRADVIENHDRWSNCEFERFFESINDFKQNWNKYLLSE